MADEMLDAMIQGEAIHKATLSAEDEKASQAAQRAFALEENMGFPGETTRKLSAELDELTPEQANVLAEIRKSDQLLIEGLNKVLHGEASAPVKKAAKALHRIMSE